jgi:hypothetical protein
MTDRTASGHDHSFGVVLYLLAWLLLPEEGEGSSILESFVGRHRL